MAKAHRQPEWHELLDQVRDEIACIRTQSGARPAAATRALERLAELGDAVGRRLESEADARRRRVVGPRGAQGAVTYRIESSPRGDSLTEIREGVARPMKVPIPVCMQVASVIAGLSEPTRFGAIHTAVEQALGDRVAPYSARVPLRYWAATGLVTHEQARFFRTLPPQKFIAEAKSGLRGLVKSEVLVDPSN